MVSAPAVANCVAGRPVKLNISLELSTRGISSLLGRIAEKSQPTSSSAAPRICELLFDAAARGLARTGGAPAPGAIARLGRLRPLNAKCHIEIERCVPGEGSGAAASWRRGGDGVCRGLSAREELKYRRHKPA